MLVTGASGFIGGHLARRLLESGEEVCCLSRSRARCRALQTTGASILKGDVEDLDSVRRAVAESEPELVFHVAGLVRARPYQRFMHVNAQGVRHIAAACDSLGSRPVLIVVSSLAAAGPCIAGDPRTEPDAAQPVSHYGRSKLAGEHAAAGFARDLPVTIVRPPIVFGPGDTGVLELLRPIAKRGVHLVPAPGNQRVSLIHVEDLVEGLIKAARAGERVAQDVEGSGVYLMAADETPSFTQLGRLFANALDREHVRVVKVPSWILRISGHVGDAMSRLRSRRSWINSDKVSEALAGSWMCSTAKAREQLDWSPALPLADRLSETVRWYREADWL